MKKLRTRKDKKHLVGREGEPVITKSVRQEDADKILKELRNSVITYTNVLEPVGEEDWEALK